MTIIDHKIPNGWEKGVLGDFIIDIKDGGTPSRQKVEYFGGEIPWAVIKDIKPKIISTSETLSELGLKNSSAKIFPKGTIILSFGATIGEVGIAGVDLATKQGIAGVLYNDKKIDTQYLYFLLQSLKKHLNKIANGSTIKEVRPSAIKNIKVCIPPIWEQKKISEILFTVDEEINKTNEIILHTEKLKKGLIQDIFTKSIKYRKLRLKDISQVTSSKRVMVSDYVTEGIPFYRSTEIIKKSKDLPVSNPLYISSKKFNFFKEHFGAPKKGDILITAVGTIGDVYMVKDEVFYFKDGNSLWIRKIKDSVLSEYLRMMLGSSFYWDKLNSIAGGSSQKALTIQKLENVEIPIPSVSEQKKLIKVISSVESEAKQYNQIKSNLNKIKKGLVHDLLSGKVRVIKK